MDAARHRGFTLVELMVTIFVIAILLAVAVPSFKSTFQRGDVASATNALAADIQYARGQASNQHRFFSLCRSVSGTGCDAGTEYDAGWIVYAYDVSSTGPNQTYAAGMDIMRVTAATRGVSLRASDNKVITFNQTGQFVTSAGRTGLTFVTCGRDVRGDTTSLGTNTAAVRGSLFTIRASGSVAVTPLPVTSSCLP